jgi:hypothetical protein
MGRWSTGACSTGQTLQLNINSFVEHIKARQPINGSISWKSGAAITVTLFFYDFSATVNLQYGKKDYEGKQQNLNYNVIIVSSPSNLGKGRIYYFICPFTGKRCKILYMAYGSLYFKCREAYRCLIYYASQLSSRLDKHNDKYWNLEHKLEKLYKSRPKSIIKAKKQGKRNE